MRAKTDSFISTEQGPVSAYVGSIQNLKDLKADLLGFGAWASARPSGQPQVPPQNQPLSPLHEPLHWRAKRDPKAKMLSLQFFLRKGVSLGYVERIQNLKDLNVEVSFQR